MTSESLGAPAAGDDALAELAAAERRIQPPETIGKLGVVNQRIAERTAEHENKSRGVITWVVMIVYCACLLLMSVLLLRLAFNGNESAAIKDAIGQALELLKVGVLPVVTLVIGYYIGQRRSGS